MMLLSVPLLTSWRPLIPSGCNTRHSYQRARRVSSDPLLTQWWTSLRTPQLGWPKPIRPGNLLYSLPWSRCIWSVYIDLNYIFILKEKVAKINLSSDHLHHFCQSIDYSCCSAICCLRNFRNSIFNYTSLSIKYQQ